MKTQQYDQVFFNSKIWEYNFGWLTQEIYNKYEFQIIRADRELVKEIRLLENPYILPIRRIVDCTYQHHKSWCLEILKPNRWNVSMREYTLETLQDNKFWDRDWLNDRLLAAIEDITTD